MKCDALYEKNDKIIQKKKTFTRYSRLQLTTNKQFK